MLPITIRKRIIGKFDIDQIQATVKEHWGKGRKRISKVLSLKGQWHQPNGQFKDMACREILLTLKRKELITLPPPLHNANNHKRNKNIPKFSVDQTPLQEDLCRLPPVKIKMVRGNDVEPLHNSLVHHYHYLGYRQIVGNHLKYIAFIGNRPVACLGWGSAAWSVKSRDSFIGWDKKTKAAVPALCDQQHQIPQRCQKTQN